MESKIRVLVVDDEPAIATHVGENLYRLGYEVPAVASCAEEAFLAASATRPDIVLMDIDLDGRSDGIEAAAKIYSELRIPIVFLTAHDDMPTLRRAQEAEPFGYMSKPIARVDLANSIETALSRFRKQNEQGVREAWLEAQLNGVGDGLIATNHDGIIWFINPEAERLLGISAIEVLGHPFVSAVPLCNRHTGRSVEDLIRLAFIQGATTDIGEDYVVNRPGNRRIAGEVAISRFSGEPVGAVFTFRDNTVESYRQDSFSNHLVSENSLQPVRLPLNLLQCLREMEPKLQATLPAATKLSLSADETLYRVSANQNILETLLNELVGKAEEKLAGKGSVHISAKNLEFERRQMDGSIARYVRIRITYLRGSTAPQYESLVRKPNPHGFRMDFSTAKIQSALQALRATAHEGAFPGLTYWDIDIPALDPTPAPASGELPPAMLVLIEPDPAVRSVLCDSYLASHNIQCLGAQDAKEALDWVRMFPGQVDVILLPEVAYSSEIEMLLNESPATSVLLITRNDKSDTKLISGRRSPSAVVDYLFSQDLLRETLVQLLHTRNQANLPEAPDDFLEAS